MQNDWPAVFKVKVKIRAQIIKCDNLYHIIASNCRFFCNQT